MQKFRWALFAILFFSVVGSSAWAQTYRGVGLGVILGEPTGVSGKIWVDNDNAFDFAAAWSLSPGNSFNIHGDYLWHNFSVFRKATPSRDGQLALYYGIGARVRSDARTRVGIRVPIGLEYQFAGAPVGLFGELAPIIDLTPNTGLGVDAALGLRFYFR